jgi:multiple sugar transport system substrate-binding protein
MTNQLGRRLRALLAAAVLITTAACSAGQDAGADNRITLWHGYTDLEAQSIGKLAERWNHEHPDQSVELVFNGGNDGALQKTLASFVSGKTPSVAYEFGSSVTPLAKRSQTRDLTELVRGTPGFDWDDFFPAVRAAATVDDKIYGVPALVDNLALVYNKKLFADAGVAEPTADWTWEDFRAAAVKTAAPDDKRYGWAYVNDGSEDTVWRFLALLWQAGGDLLSPDGKKAAFDSPAGLSAMNLLRDMAVTDRSVYLDTGDQQYINLFNSGKLAMMWTGPWDLGTINDDVSYGVQVLPGKLTHATVSGPDNYMFFGADAEKRAWPFMQWLLSPEIHMEFALDTGDLPLRQSEQKLPAYKEYQDKYPGTEVFVDNLEHNVTKARPNIPQYGEISQSLGRAVQSVLLGQATPQDALTAARTEADRSLAGS